jgi:hypothetical protein
MIASAFTVLSLSLILLWAIGSKRDPDGVLRARTTPILIAAVIPLALVASAFEAGRNSFDHHADRWGDTRFSLTGLQVSPALLDDSVTVGAAAAAAGEVPAGPSDIVVAGLPARIVTFTRTPAGLGIAVRYAGAGDQVGVVALNGKLIGAAPLAEGDVLCLEDCTGPRPHSLRFVHGRWAAAGGGALGPAVPHRQALNLLPALVGWKPTARVFPLRDYGRAQLAVAPQADPCTGRLLCLSGGAPVRTVMFQGPFPASSLEVVLLDPGAQLIRKGAVVATTPAGQIAATLKPGRTRARLALLRVDYADPEQSLEAPQQDFSRLIERRSFGLAYSTTAGLEIALDSPSSILVSRDSLVDAKKAEARTDKAAGALPTEGVRLRIGADDRTSTRGEADPKLAFEVLGPRFSREVEARLTVPDPAEAPYAGGFRAEVAQASGRQPGQPFGAPFTVGGDLRARLRIDRLDPRTGLLGAAPWILLSSVLLACVDLGRRRASPQRWMIASALDYLLAVRLLVAVGGAYVDGGTRANQAVGDALAAFVAVPLLLSLLPSPGRPGRLVECAYAVYAVIALGTLIRLGANSAPVITLFAGAWLIAVLRAPAGLNSTLGERLLALLRLRLRARLARINGFWRPGSSTVAGADVPGWAVGIIVAAVVLRLVLGLFGQKETVTLFGERLALSLVYLPAILIGFGAILAAGAREAAAPNAFAGFLFAALLGLATAVVPLGLQDNGFVIFALPMALLGWLVHWRRCGGTGRWLAETLAAVAALAVFWWLLLGPLTAKALAMPRGLIFGLAIFAVAAMVIAALRWSRSVLWAAPAIAAVTFIVVLHSAPKTSAGSVERVAAGGDLNRELALLDRYTSENQNVLRVLNIAQPNRVQESGTRSSERFVAAMAHLEQYTRTPADPDALPGAGLLGRGFLNLEPPTLLRPYHLNDNVSAIHLIAPFGRLGAAALLAVLWALAVFTMRRGSAPDPQFDGRTGRAVELDIPWTATTASLALWTIALIGTYMVLANLQFVPFTGKNVYFLAAASSGDLTEGTLLLAMALFLGGARNGR